MDANTIVPNKPQWISGCTLCNDGIVEEVKRLVDTGKVKSEHKACQLMAEQAAKVFPELAKDFSAQRIRDRYRYYTDGHGAKLGESPKKPDENVKRPSQPVSVDPETGEKTPIKKTRKKDPLDGMPSDIGEYVTRVTDMVEETCILLSYTTGNLHKITIDEVLVPFTQKLIKAKQIVTTLLEELASGVK